MSNTTDDFKPLQYVTYIPNHAGDNYMHPDVERGRVTSINSTYVFVCFDDTGRGKACSPSNLIPTKTPSKP